MSAILTNHSNLDDDHSKDSDLYDATSPGSEDNMTSPASTFSDDLPAINFSPTTSHARKRKPGHIPRPPNAFMIFRSDLWRNKKLTPNVERDHRNVSCIAAYLWNNLTPEKRKPYQDRAEQAKQRHILEHPGYKYSPVSRKQKSARRKVRDDDKGKKRIDKVAFHLSRGVEGLELEKIMKNDDDDADTGMDVFKNASSTSQSRRRSSRFPQADKEFTQNVTGKVENNIGIYNDGNLPVNTHHIVSDFPIQPEFVPTADIPAMDLSLTEKQVYEAYNYDLQPPRFAPSYIEPHSGVKPQALEFTQPHMVSLNQNIEEPEFYPTNMTDTVMNMDYFSDPVFSTFNSAPDPSSSFGYQFQDAYATGQHIPVYNEAGYALFQHQHLNLNQSSSVFMDINDPVLENGLQFWS